MQHVVCHVVRKDISAVKFDRVEIAVILVLFRLKRLIEEGGEETGVHGETLDDELQKVRRCAVQIPGYTGD